MKFLYAKCISSESFPIVCLGKNPFDSKPEELVWSQNEKFVKLFVPPSHRRYFQKQTSRTSVAFKIGES